MYFFGAAIFFVHLIDDDNWFYPQSEAFWRVKSGLRPVLRRHPLVTRRHQPSWGHALLHRRSRRDRSIDDVDFNVFVVDRNVLKQWWYLFHALSRCCRGLIRPAAWLSLNWFLFGEAFYRLLLFLVNVGDDCNISDFLCHLDVIFKKRRKGTINYFKINYNLLIINELWWLFGKF